MSILKDLTKAGITGFKSILNQNVFKNVKEKTIPIPESLIRYKLSKMLSEHDIEIDELKCSEKGIHIQTKASKMGVKMNYGLDVKIEQLQVNPIEHKAVIAVLSDSLHGENIAGSIASWIIKLVIDDIVAKSIDTTDSQVVVSYDKSTRKATGDLMSIKQVAMLYEPKTILGGKSAIQFFEVNSVSHTDLGLTVHFDFKTDMPLGKASGFVEKFLGL